MKKYFIFFLVLNFYVINFFAQEQGFLTGKVIYDNEAVAFANIAISKNEGLITGTSTNLDGTYSIQLIPDNYVVEITSMGFCKEKREVKIKSGETIRLEVQLYEAKYNIVTIYDTINVEVVELNNIDDKFKLVIDNHIKELRKKHFFHSPKKNIILINLLDRIYYEYEDITIKNKTLKYLNFKENSFGDGYDVIINTIGINNEPIQELKYFRKQFHYRYKNWNIFFVTRIENFKFPFEDSLKKYVFYTHFSDIEEDKNGKYDMFDNEIKSYWDKGILYKKYEYFYTSYFISDFEVIFKIDKSKCLICKPIIR